MAKRPRSEEEDDDLQYADHDYEIPQQKGLKKICNRVKWTRDEDDKLKKLVEQNGTDDWTFIASHLQNRSDFQCQHRWQKVLNPELIKGPWTKEEDQRVIELVQKYGPKRWSLIAKHLKGRIGKQCRERWHNHLNPEVKKSSWTEEEDRIIYEAHKRLGNRWAEIAKLLPGRTDNSIKNHWNSTMRRKVEQEGYLQDGIKTEQPSSSKLQHKPCATVEHLQTQNQFYIPVQAQIPGYQYVSSEGSCIEHVSSSSNLIQHPFVDDDPDKEKKIKELELLLMSAENEIRRKRVSSQTGSFSSWSGSFIMEDSMSNTLNSLEEQTSEFYSMDEAQGTAAQQNSPTKYLAVEANAVLSSLQTIPEFAETLELIESDPVAWSDVTSFDLSEAANSPVKPAPVTLRIQHNEGAMECQFNVSVVLDGKKNSCSSGEEEILSTSPSIAKFSTPPAILRKKKRLRVGQSPVNELNDGSYNDAVNVALKQTPVKTLPFSPSQFFNTCSGNEQFNLENPAFTSTPICGQKVLITTPLHKEMTPKDQKENAGFRTPTIRRSLLGTTPRTPTPFKNALAAQEKKYGPLKIVISHNAQKAPVRCQKIATALDRRFKNLKCLPKSERDEVWSLLPKVLKEQHSDVETTEPKPPKKKINLLLVASDSDDKNEHASVRTALDCYRPIISMDTSSGMVTFVSRKWAALSPANANKLVCLSDWLNEKLEPSQPLAFLEEDIREVLKEETGTDIFLKEEDDSVYKSCKQEHTSAKKVRKSLVLDSWEKEELGAQLFTEENVLDVQSENIYTTSLLMIPLLEIHDSRCNLTLEKQATTSTNKTNAVIKKKLNSCTSKNVKMEKSLQSNCEWEAVVYGKTEDQLIMTEQARQYLSTYTASSSTSRALIL